MEPEPYPSPVQMVDASPAEYAAGCTEFYNKLIALGVEKEFAQKLTIAFCMRQ